jgi:hypothetical protein
VEQRRSKLCVFVFRLLIAQTGWVGEACSSVWLLRKDRVKVSETCCGHKPVVNSESILGGDNLFYIKAKLPSINY